MTDKTEEASPKRLQQSRDKGQIAQSKDAVATAAVVAGLAGAYASRSTLYEAFVTSLGYAVRAASTPGTPPIAGALTHAAQSALLALLPSLAAGAAAATLVGALLSGFLFAPAAALPSLEKIDPFSALGRYAKPRTYVEPLTQLAKGALFAYLGYLVAYDALGAMVLASRADAHGFSSVLSATVRAVVTRMAAVAAFVAGLDVLYRRWQHAQDQRMSKDELKREHKESEGDEHAKHERDKLHKELVNEATVHNVRKAQFVVTNPTHYAVALAWDDESMEAPELLAKGEGELARRIIAEAHFHGVPVLRDAPLARSLHELEVGESIPEALYEAVAAVVSFLADGGDPERFDP